jgi:hypothetical protein
VRAADGCSCVEPWSGCGGYPRPFWAVAHFRPAQPIRTAAFLSVDVCFMSRPYDPLPKSHDAKVLRLQCETRRINDRDCAAVSETPVTTQRGCPFQIYARINAISATCPPSRRRYRRETGTVAGCDKAHVKRASTALSTLALLQSDASPVQPRQKKEQSSRSDANPTTAAVG